MNSDVLKLIHSLFTHLYEALLGTPEEITSSLPETANSYKERKMMQVSKRREIILEMEDFDSSSQ